MYVAIVVLGFVLLSAQSNQKMNSLSSSAQRFQIFGAETEEQSAPDNPDQVIEVHSEVISSLAISAAEISSHDFH